VTAADADELDRTLKIELDSGRAASKTDANALVRTYVLQIDVGPAIVASRARQVSLLTAVNAARRAFPGGVFVRTQDNPPLTVPWARGERLRAVVERFGGRLADALDPDRLTLVIGDPPMLSGDARVLHPTFEGWVAAAVLRRADRLPESTDFSLAGVLAGSLAVSEAFQSVRGEPLAARRDVGLSLWRPDLSWRSAEAAGEDWSYLPSRLWLLGLGHLGQAVAWTIGSLPYADPNNVEVMLLDDDIIVRANAATGLLVPVAWTRERKTRLVSRQLESIGIRTRMSERRFGLRTSRQPTEPGLAIAGFDDPEPRRALEEAGFDQVIDLGLGGGPAQYLDLLMHVFPSSLSSAAAFPSSDRAGHVADLLDQPGYRQWAQELAQRGLTEQQIKCGLLDVAGRTVGAAFVGGVAASLGVAEAIRMLVGGPQFEVLGLSLRSPQFVDAAVNTYEGPPRNPGFTDAGPRR
jgi:hypothetical protein